MKYSLVLLTLLSGCGYPFPQEGTTSEHINQGEVLCKANGGVKGIYSPETWNCEGKVVGISATYLCNNFATFTQDTVPAGKCR